MTFAFDEFAVSTRPNASYSWAMRNTRPQVKSNEAKREKINGLLTIDLITAKEYLKLEQVAKTPEIAQYIVNLTLDQLKDNPQLQTINIFLDNNPTHKTKLRTLINEITIELYKKRKGKKRPKYLPKFKDFPTINFYYFAPYSPDDNPVEYDIRLIRQLALHHLPLNTTLDQLASQLQTKIQNQQFMTHEKLQNTLKHIFSF
jgi:DDE superfamily endonuclease